MTEETTPAVYPVPPVIREALEALKESRRYITNFGSVEPSAHVHRLNEITLKLSRWSDEQCSLWQYEGVLAARARDGRPPITYSQFCAGFGDD